MLLLSYNQHCNDDRILCRKIMESDRSQVLGMAKYYAQLIKVEALVLILLYLVTQSVV